MKYKKIIVGLAWLVYLILSTLFILTAVSPIALMVHG